MTEFVKKANDAVGTRAVQGMVDRDLKYKRDARKRQIASIVLLCFLIILISFFTYSQLQTQEALNQILIKVSNVVAQ